jgi:hypothetical protein
MTGHLSLTGGFNASWFQMNDEFRVEPRLSLSWEASSRHRFSLGYGHHSQTEPLLIYYVTRQDSETGEILRPNKDLERSRAHHFVLGYDWSLTDNLRLKVEPYYQSLYNVPVQQGTPYSVLNFRSDWTFDKVLINDGTGTNIGVDLTLERFLNNGLYYMTTASVYDSKYTGGDGVEHRTRYDGGYVVNFLGGKEWSIRGKNLLGINVKFTFMGPYWFHPVDLEATRQAGEVIYDETRPFNDRHSRMESITDLTINYRINSSRSSSVLALQIKNLAGRQYQGKRYNLETGNIEDEFFYSPIPFVSYKIEF